MNSQENWQEPDPSHKEATLISNSTLDREQFKRAYRDYSYKAALPDRSITIRSTVSSLTLSVLTEILVNARDLIILYIYKVCLPPCLSGGAVVFSTGILRKPNVVSILNNSKALDQSHGLIRSVALKLSPSYWRYCFFPEVDLSYFISLAVPLSFSDRELENRFIPALK